MNTALHDEREHLSSLYAKLKPLAEIPWEQRTPLQCEAVEMLAYEAAISRDRIRGMLKEQDREA